MVFEVIVTDVTRYGDLFCVAGMDRATGRMIRPEPPGANKADEASRFWPASVASAGAFFSVGHVVSFSANPPPNDFPLPHATEDHLVQTDQPHQLLHAIALADLPTAVIGSVSPSLNVAFNGGLVRSNNSKAYVPSNFVGRSLGAVVIAPAALEFHVNDYDPNKKKLRARIWEGGIGYDVAVTSDAEIQRWHELGIEALQAFWNARPSIHVRVGLSRPFPARPDECFLQINGLI